jgi:hypothetical protein
MCNRTTRQLALLASLLLLASCSSADGGIGLSQKRAEGIVSNAAPAAVFGPAPSDGEYLGVRVLSFAAGSDDAPMVFTFGEPRSLTALGVVRVFPRVHEDEAFGQMRAIAAGIGEALGSQQKSWMAYQLERAAHEKEGSVQQVFEHDVKIRVDWGLPDDADKSNVSLFIMVPSFPVYWDDQSRARG